MTRVRAFMASSLDGFIAGPNHELDWLEAAAGTEDTFTPFMAQVGAMLMGRRTYEVVAGFDGPWPYGTTPMLVATTRELVSPHESVRPVSGDIDHMVAEAKAAAATKDVYIDGGALTRSALAKGLVDEITITMIPMILGAGISLFAGLAARQALALMSQRELGGGLVELVYEPAR